MVKKAIISVVVIGIILTTIGIILAGGSFEKIVDAFNSDDEYRFMEKSGNQEVKALNIKMSAGNVIFHIFDGEGYKIDYYESEYDIKEVSFEDNTLNIINKVKFRLKIFNINFKSSKISTLNVYLPNSFNGKANIETASGNITISDYNFESLIINVSSGNTKLSNVNVEEDVNINTSSGTISLSSFRAKSLDIKSSSGGINIDDIAIDTKVYIKSSSGHIDINEGIIDSIEVYASSGNVDIIDVECDDIDVVLSSGKTKIKLIGNVDDYKIDARTSSGSIYYQGNKIKGSIYDPSGSKSIKVRCSSGNIEIDFIKNE